LQAAGFHTAQITQVADTSGITGTLQYLWNAYTGDPRGNRVRHSRLLAGLFRPVAWLAVIFGAGEVLRAIAWKSERLRR